MKKRTFEIGEAVEYRVCSGYTIGEVVSYDSKTGSVGIRTARGKLLTRPDRSVRPLKVALSETVPA